MRKLVILMWACSGLSGCASLYVSNAEKNYLESRNGPNLVVPKSLTDSNLSGFYVLPTPTEVKKVELTPPNFAG